jgi:hypothetical protein
MLVNSTVRTRPPVLEMPAGHVGVPVPQLTVTSFKVNVVYDTVIGVVTSGHDGEVVGKRECVSPLPEAAGFAMMPVRAMLLGGPVAGLRVLSEVQESTAVTTETTELVQLPVPVIVRFVLLSCWLACAGLKSSPVVARTRVSEIAPTVAIRKYGRRPMPLAALEMYSNLFIFCFFL